MTQHVWKSKRLTNTTIFRGVAAYWQTRTRQGMCLTALPTSDGGYRLAFAFTGYFLERYRQSGSVAAWALWDSAERSGHRYASGGNGGNYEAVGRRVLCAALVEEWRGNHTGQLLRHEPLLEALLGAFEEAGAWQPLRDYLEEKRYERMINFFETGHPERVPSPDPLGGGIPFWADGSTLP